MSTNAPVKLNISDLPSTSRCPVHWHASLNNTMCHSGSSISDLYDIVNTIRSMMISDADNLEVNLVLDLARARWDVVNAEKVLADCVVCKHEVLANLSKHKFNISKQKLTKADVGIAHMQITFQKHGLSHHRPAQSVLQESLECHHITVQLD
ncbi:uncharacterized protein BJ212DRAFT_1480602 [Suillus subaureus]|uniref:Uncharacterized protein n=1 Tax=Suillus subaureus TaxID=48587 RepID=A0A9P7EBT2_9AGAM|nr:uncharacterized protein BJ212DRAFT_1480602 [Suillus subaureus]KAG1816743.1 hypothetical protein BJ212DRAFT_1480602 [Suillus subaureus]